MDTSLHEQVENLQKGRTEQNEQIAKLQEALLERNQQLAQLQQELVNRTEQILSFSQAVAERDNHISALKEDILAIRASTSWRITRPLRMLKRTLSLPLADSALRYRFMKAVYWSLPQVLRIRLHSIRSAIVSKNLARLASSQAAHNNISQPVSYSPLWVNLANRAAKLAIIPCSFEFEELVNQRPINAAKYFADQGYFVIFVAWQWFPKQRLDQGSTEVSTNIFQVPLFDFIASADHLTQRSDAASLYLATLPAKPLVQLVRLLRYKGMAIVYDIMDEWEGFAKVGQAPWYDEEIERSLVLESDHVVAVSPPLADKFSDLRSDIIVIGNGYSAATLGDKSKFIAVQTKKTELIVGYFGHLTDAWFDWELLLNVARELQDFKFEIIGYGIPDWLREQVSQVPNIHLLGKVPPSELHKFAQHWSVALIPFLASCLAEAVDPIKIYEYLFFGLPTVATGIRHIERYPYTRFACDTSEVIVAIKNAVKIPIDVYQLEPFLAETTWTKRFSKISALLEVNSLRQLYVH